MKNTFNYFLELQYLGTHYHGWQTQPNAQTVQSVLENSLSTLLKSPISVMGSGRTDTGVHALQQFAQFVSIEALNLPVFLHRLNGVLPKDIAVKRILPVTDRAHARFDAQRREYLYFMHLKKNPFLEGRSWFCPYEIDIQKLNHLSQILSEYSDFECFSKVKTSVNHFRCKIIQAGWEQKDGQLIFHIVADRFLRGMVRAIVGTLLLAGRGKMDENDFRAVLESKDRKKAGASAPPQGLFLTKVHYPSHIFKPNLERD